MKRLLYIVLLHAGVLVTKSTNQLTKVYYHTGPTSDQLVLYFAQKPDCTVLPKKEISEGKKVTVAKNGPLQFDFFMPHTALSKKAQKSFDELTKQPHADYRCALKEDKGKKGILLSVIFDPKKIGFQQESFEAITGNPALSFTFFNRSALQHINAASRPLLRTAQVKKKRVLF